MKSLAKILSGLFLAVMIAVTSFQGIASAAPAQNAFAGTWICSACWSLTGIVVTVEEEQNIITLKWPGRPIFKGFEVDLYAPTISINFSDTPGVVSGVLSGNKVLWSNGAVWTKK